MSKKSLSFIELYNFLLSIDNKKIIFKATLVSILFSLIESIGIFGLLPFLALLENPNLVYENTYIKTIYEYINVDNYQKFVLYFGFLIFIFLVFSSVLGSLGRYIQTYITSYINVNVSSFVLKTFLNSDLEKIKTIDHSKFVSILYQETDRFTEKYIVNLINILKNILTIFIVSFLIFLRDIYIALTVIGFYLLIFFIILYFFNSKSKNLSSSITKNHHSIVRYLSNSLKGIKFIYLKKLQYFVYNKLLKEINLKKKLVDLQGLINATSKSIIELSVFGPLIFFSILIVYVYNYQSLVTNLIFFGFCAYRVLPAVQQILLSSNIINHHYTSFYSISEMIDFKKTNVIFEKNEFTNYLKEKINSISIEGLYFNYGKNIIFNNCNLKLESGKSYILTGKSGIGKSTLVDIILGITVPKRGKVEINNNSINSKKSTKILSQISYLSQNIFLFRDTIKNNIILDRIIDSKLLDKAIDTANLVNDLKARQDGIKNFLGDNNEAVSGGQAQRINIARAFYDYPTAIILDEPTSSLDQINAKKILKKILKDYNNLIILCISHDESVIDHFDYIITIKNQKIEMTKQIK